MTRVKARRLQIADKFNAEQARAARHALAALLPLKGDARARVMAYLVDRFVNHSEEKP